MSTTEPFETVGNIPLPRFGHSITYYAKNKVCLFGGATGTTGQFSITDNTYTLDLITKSWKKVEGKNQFNFSYRVGSVCQSSSWFSMHLNK